MSGPMVSAFPAFLNVYKAEAGCDRCAVHVVYSWDSGYWAIMHNGHQIAAIHDSDLRKVADDPNALRPFFVVPLASQHEPVGAFDGQ